MGLFSTISEVLRASTGSTSTTRGGSGERSAGAYWCHDCSERVLDVDVEGDEPPTCPDCGAEMEFERSPESTGCAC